MKKDKKKENTNKEGRKEGKVRKIFQKVENGLRKKWLVDGTKTIVLVVLMIAIYIGINMLLENVILPEFDGTENKVYSLSQETKDKVGSIEDDVTITLINYSNYTSVIRFAEKYVELNEHISIEKVDDLSARPDLMQTYSLESTDSLIIVKSGDKETTISSYDLYTYDYSTYEEVDLTEEAITNAIVNVITAEKPKVYFMNTHLAYNEQYYSTMMEEMEKESNEVETLDILANGGIPEDCDCLIISTLKEDITEQEKDNIIAYIQNGGELLLLCGPNITNVDLSNFQEVLDEYGITISNGVVFEGDSANMVAGYPDFIIAETQTTSLTDQLNMSMNLCFIDAGKITFDEEKLEELGVEYETLATTSEEAYLRTNLEQTSPTRTSQDGELESCMIAAIATKTMEEGKTSKVVVYSNELFAMNRPIQISGYTMYTIDLYNNQDLILNSISYLNEREDTITIRKDYDTVTYTVTQQQNTIIMAIIFILPFAIIFLGIVVWQIRRRKK